MRTAGMIGGLGPESTIDYYRSILARYRERKPDGGIPHILINSLDVDKGIAMLDAGRLRDLADYLATGVESLENAGADFGFIAANTPHIVFEDLQQRSMIPLLSIVKATAARAKALGLTKVGLFGTGFTNAIGQWFWTKALQFAPAPAVTPFYYLMLVWALMFGFFIWGDVPSASLLVGSAIAAMVAMVSASHSLQVFLDGFRLMLDNVWSRVTGWF